MVVNRDVSIPVPQFTQLLVLETKIAQYRHCAVHQLLGLHRIGKLRRLLGEEFRFTHAVVLKPLGLFDRLLFLDRCDFPMDSRQTLLRGIPLGVADRIVDGELLHVIHGLDIGKFSVMGSLHVGQQDRQGMFVLATRLFRKRAFGLQGLGSFSGLLLSPGEVAVAGPLTIGKAFLRFAREGLEQFPCLPSTKTSAARWEVAPRT